MIIDSTRQTDFPDSSVVIAYSCYSGGGSQNSGNAPGAQAATAVCAAIKAKQPPGCITKPIIVGVNGGVPNGCGVGGVTDFSLRQALAQSYGSVFTGDLNTPMLNVSFRNGCDAHDACYGRQGGFDACNSSMTTAIQSACTTALNVATCSGMAGLYTGAIGSDTARTNYAKDGVALQCLKYQNDLTSNGCSQ